MVLTRAYIHDATGFDNGDLFRSEEQVREYFSIPNIEAMFGSCPFTQEQLDEMAEEVIRHGWHMERRPLWCAYCGTRFELAADELERAIGPSASDPSEWTPQAVAGFLRERFGHTCGE